MRIATCLSCSSLWVLASCAADPEPASIRAEVPESALALFDVEVAVLSTESAQGSAVPLRENLFLTCRHVLAADAEGVRLSGRTRDLRVVSSGPTPSWADDWTFFEVATRPHRRPPTHRYNRYDPDRELRPGDEIYLLGHRSATAEVVSILRGKVAAQSDDWSLPAGLLCVEAGDVPADVNRGMSGGAAVVIDRDTDEAVVVGILVGRLRVSLRDEVIGEPNLIVRPQLPGTPQRTGTNSATEQEFVRRR